MNSTMTESRPVPERGTKVRLRKVWLTIHRWLGLTVGLLIVLLGLTGSLLVFDHAIDEWLNPELLLTDGGGARRPLLDVIAAAGRARAGGTSHALAVSKPRVVNGIWTIWFQEGTESQPTFALVYVDPYTAEVTGQRVWGTDLLSCIYKLHFTLHGGDFGETVVGVAGLLLLISIGSGLCLWWPLWKSGWRPAFAIRSGPRFNYDLHKVVGVFSSAVLLVVAFTGVYMVFPETPHLPSASSGTTNRRSACDDHIERMTQRLAASFVTNGRDPDVCGWLARGGG